MSARTVPTAPKKRSADKSLEESFEDSQVVDSPYLSSLSRKAKRAKKATTKPRISTDVEGGFLPVTREVWNDFKEKSVNEGQVNDYVWVDDVCIFFLRI